MSKDFIKGGFARRQSGNARSLNTVSSQDTIPDRDVPFNLNKPSESGFMAWKTRWWSRVMWLFILLVALATVILWVAHSNAN